MESSKDSNRKAGATLHFFTFVSQFSFGFVKTCPIGQFFAVVAQIVILTQFFNLLKTHSILLAHCSRYDMPVVYCIKFCNLYFKGLFRGDYDETTILVFDIAQLAVGGVSVLNVLKIHARRPNIADTFIILPILILFTYSIINIGERFFERRV